MPPGADAMWHFSRRVRAVARSLFDPFARWWSPPAGPVPADVLAPASPPAPSTAPVHAPVVPRLVVPRLVGMSSADYARRFGARWRPTHPATTIDWPVPRTHPGGPGTPPHVDFGTFLRREMPELGVLEIEGATLVRPWGWLIGADGIILSDHTWFSHRFDATGVHEGRFARFVDHVLRNAEATPLPGTTLSLLSDFAADNYCHFLLDALGRLALVEAAGIDLVGIDRILVPEPCSENARRILAASFLPAEKIVFVAAEPKTRFLPERLLAPTFPGAPACYVPPVAAELRRRLHRHAAPAGSATRLYIDRTAPRRPLENRAEVLALMEAYGFRIYDPSEHDDQPADFAAADVIVGAHGAGLANLVFCQPGTRVLELMPTDQMHPYYHTLSWAAGLDYSVLPCRSAEERPPGDFSPSPHPFRVDIDCLRTALGAIGCDGRARTKG